MMKMVMVAPKSILAKAKLINLSLTLLKPVVSDKAWLKQSLTRKNYPSIGCQFHNTEHIREDPVKNDRPGDDGTLRSVYTPGVTAYKKQWKIMKNYEKL